MKMMTYDDSVKDKLSQLEMGVRVDETLLLYRGLSFETIDKLVKIGFLKRYDADPEDKEAENQYELMQAGYDFCWDELRIMTEQLTRFAKEAREK